METKTTITVTTNNEWVTTKDGIRMTYKEYLDMIRSERN